MNPSHRREGLLLKIVNVAACLFFLWSDFYTVASPQPAYKNIKQTYLTPATWVFFIYPIIHALLLGTVIYQFASAHGETVVVDGISLWFPLMAIASAIFLIVRANHYYTIAFVLSLFILYIGINIEWIIDKEHPPSSVADELLVFPFYVWDAWNFVICFLTAFEAFGVDATEHQDGTWTRISVILALLTMQFVAAGTAFSASTGDRVGAFVISWAFWAIYDHQRSSGFIHGFATASAILSLLWVFVATDGIYRKFSGRDTFIAKGERAPRPSHRSTINNNDVDLFSDENIQFLRNLFDEVLLFLR